MADHRDASCAPAKRIVEGDQIADASALAEDAAPRCAACDDCESQRDRIGPSGPSWDRIPEVTTRDEVLNYPGITGHTRERHKVDRDGICARYDLSVDLPCSLLGRHLHKKGIIVRTLCGMTLRMGFVCGGKSVADFEDIVKDYRRRRRFERDADYVADWGPRFKPTIEELEPALKERLAVHDTLKHDLPVVYAELSVRRSKHSALGTRVRVNDEEHHLEGLSIVDAKRLHEPSRLRDYLAQFEQAYASAPPIDGPSAAKLLRIAQSAEDKAIAEREWLRETVKFTNRENLLLALVAARCADPKVVSERGRWRVTHFGSGNGALIAPFSGPG